MRRPLLLPKLSPVFQTFLARCGAGFPPTTVTSGTDGINVTLDPKVVLTHLLKTGSEASRPFIRAADTENVAA
jgi:hypothetical protein